MHLIILCFVFSFFLFCVCGGGGGGFVYYSTRIDVSFCVALSISF